MCTELGQPQALMWEGASFCLFLAGHGQASLEVSPIAHGLVLAGPLGKEGIYLGPHSSLFAPQELALQMNLLELIRKLQHRGCQAGKAAL